MNRISFVFALILLLLIPFIHSQAQEYKIIATSPDHPKTWAVGASETWRSLHWENGILVAHVTFSTQDYADKTHGVEEEDYRLTFPTIHSNAGVTHRSSDLQIQVLDGRIYASLIKERDHIVY